MVRAIARGLAAAPNSPAMHFTDAGSGRAQALAREVGGEYAPSVADLPRLADLVVIGCKPKDLTNIASELQGAPFVLSILGATSLTKLRAALPGSSVDRAMPNLPVSIGHGVVCLAEEGDRPADVEALLAPIGRFVVVSEELLDPATAVMGCSPAYVDLFIDTLTAAGANAGLPDALARELVVESVIGTGLLAKNTERGEIREAVASPGGSTEAGLDALGSTGFSESLVSAANASLARMRGDI